MERTKVILSSQSASSVMQTASNGVGKAIDTMKSAAAKAESYPEHGALNKLHIVMAAIERATAEGKSVMVEVLVR